MYSGSDDAKERIRQTIDIVDVVGDHIQLRRQGRNMVGLCPWHDDSRPSLQVNPDRQTWKCWVCDVGGDIFSFVMQREGIDFREAMEMLAERAGIELHANSGRPAPAGSPSDKNTLYRAMAWATERFHSYLVRAPEADVARRYLSERGIHDDTIQRFRLGFAPNQWHWITRAHEFSFEVLQAVGLSASSDRTGQGFDRFRGRVMFPICDPQGRPIAIGGRILPQWADDKTAKYINSPETRLFSKSDQLYGLHLARDHVSKQREVVIMEGYTDVLIAHQFGLDTSVAVLGTALGPRHMPLLRRYADRIILLLDGDDAGRRRASEILELFIANQVDLRIVTLPDNLDPCDFLMKNGRAALQALIDDAPDAWDYKVQLELQGVDVLRDNHRANRALENLLATFAKSPASSARSAGASRLRSQQMLNRLAREFRLDEAELHERLDEHRRQQARSGRRSPAPESVGEPQKLEAIERDLFELLMQQPEAVATVLESIPRSALLTQIARDIFQLYESLEREGTVPEFDNLLLATNDPALKNVLVGIDDAGSKKSNIDRELALRELLHTFARRQTDAQTRQKEAALENDDLDHDQKIAVLKEILRARQDLSQ